MKTNLTKNPSREKLTEIFIF